MSLADKLKTVKRAAPCRTSPVWEGPESTGPQGGITFSLLSRFLCCRERFRLLVVEGLRASSGFSHRMEYGNMWHLCEEWHAKGNDPTRGNRQDRLRPLWEDALLNYAKGLAHRYPLEQEKVDHWYRVCKAQFPLYVEYWSKHPDVTGRTPLLQEHVFNVAYSLPSGRTVRLRGKWDSVDLVGKTPKAAVWLQENKTKGDIWEPRMIRQLTFDLQTMMYLTALTEEQRRLDDSTVKARLFYRRGTERHYYPIAGVRYNVVRRPLSGGKYSITRHKARGKEPEETREHFYTRLGGLIAADPDHFFMRWNVTVTPGDVAKFRRECLDPILEQLCDWWAWVTSGMNVWRGKLDDPDSPAVENHIHWRHPFGVYNPLDEGRESDLDEHLATGSELGLERCGQLFGELQS